MDIDLSRDIGLDVPNEGPDAGCNPIPAAISTITEAPCQTGATLYGTYDSR